MAFFLSGYSGEILAIKFHEIIKFVAMPMKAGEFIYKPWTLFTYFFAQVEVGHIFFNLLILYFFGSILQAYIGFSRTLAIYFYAGIVGGLITILLHSTVPALYNDASVLIGASGSVMGIVIATATLAPDKKIMALFLGEIKLIYIALFYVVIDLIGITYIDGVGHVCHLGGAIAGFWFIYSMQRGKDYSRGFNKVFYGIKNIFTGKKTPKMKVVKNKSSTNYKQQPTNEKTSEIQAKIDAILDKISKGGYESLSKQEKDYLFTHGKNV